MPIPLSCPCGRRYQVKDELAGKRIRCRLCGEVLAVPAADGDVVEDLIVDDETARKPTSVTTNRPNRFTRSEEALPVPRVRPAYDEAEDEPRPPRPRRKKRRTPRYDGERRGGFPISISPGIVAGFLMMVLAVVWFVLGLFFGWIFFYPPILFIIGLVRFVMSLLGHEED